MNRGGPGRPGGVLRRLLRAVPHRLRNPGPRTRSGPVPPDPPATYPGDFRGRTRIRYAPHRDGRADPGEVVWAWVPFEEDPTRGKDRPVLVVGRDGRWLLALPLTSRDHDRDTVEARRGRSWLDIGSGAWDPRGRPSEVRLDRVVRLDPATVRREGCGLDPVRFATVAEALRGLHGWD